MNISPVLDILLLEDHPADAELVQREVSRSGLKVRWHHASSEEQYLAHLTLPPDVILADYSLDGFDALRALALLPRRLSDVPFIIVTGSISEEVAVDCLKQGASDYVLKDRLGRLPQAIDNALRTSNDRAEKRRAQARLAESERRYRRLFTQNLGGVFISDADGTLLDCNPAFARMFGFTSVAEALRANVRALYPDPDLRTRMFERLQARDQVHLQEHTMQTVGGTPVRVLESAVGEFDSSGGLARVSGYLADITASWNAERNRDLLAAAVESASDAIFITDMKGIIQYVNPAFVKLAGVSKSEARGRSPRFLKSGKQDDAFYRDLWATILSGGVFRGQWTNRRADGGTYDVDGTITPIRDHDSGEIVNFVAIHRDVTKERMLEEQIRQAQKMETLGQLSGGIAHDFNNEISIIRLNAEVLLDDLRAGHPPNPDDLEAICGSATRAARITRQLLDFTRKQPMTPSVVSLGDLVEDLAPVVRRLLPETVEMNVKTPSEPCTVWVDAQTVEQCVVNLCANARDAMREGGTLTLAVTCGTEAGPSEHEDGPAPEVQIVVTDTGTGMTEEAKGRAFEPFFTTKPKGQGTGLGLSMVKGLVEQLRGRVELESTLGKGTTVRLVFPAAAAVAPVSREAPAPPEPGKADGELILVVEDDATLRSASRRALERAGFTVITATDGQDALRQYDEHAADVAVVISDRIMPVMDGEELYRRLAERRASIPFVMASGHVDDLDPELRDVTLVRKPWDIPTLLHAIDVARSRPSTEPGAESTHG